MAVAGNQPEIRPGVAVEVERDFTHETYQAEVVAETDDETVQVIAQGMADPVEVDREDIQRKGFSLETL